MAVIEHLLMSILPFVAVLSVVVFVHEFGHFQAARWCRIAVKSFSIGMGSELFGWTDKHGTRWKVSSIPIGGFVSWLDDTDPTSTAPPTEEYSQLPQEEARKRGYYRAQPAWMRALVVAAGPFTNFVFAILVFAFVAMIVGRDVTDYNSFAPKIAGVAPRSAASAAGIQVGDVIAAVDGQTITTWKQFQDIVAQRGATRMALTLTHDGATRIVGLTPQIADHPGPNGSIVHGPVVGVALDQSTGPQVIASVGPVDAVVQGAQQSWQLVASTGEYLYGMATGRNSGSDIAGPLGILNQSGKVAQASLAGHDNDFLGGLGSLGLSLLFFAAMLSVAVGFVNVLPIPVLDGGHFVFYVIEGIRGGKPLPPAAQEWAFRAGLAVMASLFLFATWNDITRWTQG
ncbi:MAG: RIP metalloprotease [Pseudomonadota bacterium]